MFRPLKAISTAEMERLQSSSISSADRSRRCRLPASRVARRFAAPCMPARWERLHMLRLMHTAAPLAAITPIRLVTETSETGEARASPAFNWIVRRSVWNEAGDDDCTHRKRSVRHVPRNPEADIVSLPWRGSCARGARPRYSAGNHRTGSARYRGRCLRLFLLPDVDGRVPKAIHQWHNRLQRSDEHVRQRARIPAGKFQRRRAVQLRYSLFRFLAGHDQGARRDHGSGYGWTLLPAADARHVDRCLCVARLANDGYQGRDFSGDARRLEAGFARKIRR